MAADLGEDILEGLDAVEAALGLRVVDRVVRGVGGHRGIDEVLGVGLGTGGGTRREDCGCGDGGHGELSSAAGPARWGLVVTHVLPPIDGPPRQPLSGARPAWVTLCGTCVPSCGTCVPDVWDREIGSPPRIRDRACSLPSPEDRLGRPYPGARRVSAVILESWRP